MRNTDGIWGDPSRCNDHEKVVAIFMHRRRHPPEQIFVLSDESPGSLLQMYEEKLDAEDVNAANEYAMMKQGTATKSKHTSYNKLESDFYSSLGKLQQMDVY
jgi:hypothetical protein